MVRGTCCHPRSQCYFLIVEGIFLTLLTHLLVANMFHFPRLLVKQISGVEGLLLLGWDIFGKRLVGFPLKYDWVRLVICLFRAPDLILPSLSWGYFVSRVSLYNGFHSGCLQRTTDHLLKYKEQFIEMRKLWHESNVHGYITTLITGHYRHVNIIFIVYLTMIMSPS